MIKESRKVFANDFSTVDNIDKDREDHYILIFQRNPQRESIRARLTSFGIGNSGGELMSGV
jgi:hypothetical protein